MTNSPITADCVNPSSFMICGKHYKTNGHQWNRHYRFCMRGGSYPTFVDLDNGTEINVMWGGMLNPAVSSSTIASQEINRGHGTGIFSFIAIERSSSPKDAMSMDFSVSKLISDNN